MEKGSINLVLLMPFLGEQGKAIYICFDFFFNLSVLSELCI